MAYELIINPNKKEHYPDRYKAVLLLDDGICRGYPKSLNLDEIMEDVHEVLGAYTNDRKLKLTVN